MGESGGTAGFGEARLLLPDTPAARAAASICQTLRDAGHRALIAGGCVRDLILGKSPKDYDVATSARPEEVAALFERTVPVGAEFGVQLVVFPEGTFEVTTFRQEGPYLDGRHPSRVDFVDERRDAERRDFTINALFLDLESGRVIDFVGGRQDLARRRIQTVGEPRERFQEDYLRLLRAIRFAARLGFEIEASTFQAICDLAPWIAKTSAERIRDELIRILTEGGARRAFELLDTTGMLEVILPEVAAMKGVEQPPDFHPEGDVWVHTLLLLEKLEDPSPTLALGALLHDVGKPATQSFDDRIRFNEHDKLGEKMALEICRRLRLPNDAANRVAWLVGQHMRIGAAREMRESKLKRFVREPGFGELLTLCRLDALASHGRTDAVDFITDYLARMPPEQVKPAPLLTGTDLIEMGYEPGPLFSEILDAVEDAQLEGIALTPEDAQEIVRSCWPLDPHGNATTDKS
jgi:poly(A) polymerase